MLYIERLERMAREHNLPLLGWSDGRPNWRRKKANFAGNCQSPKTVELFSRPGVKDSRYILVPKDGMAMTIDLEVRCRQCAACLKARAAHWRMRALAEYRCSEAVGGRTWFGTLTLSPASRMRVVNECRRGPLKNAGGYNRIANWDQGIDFDALDADKQFRAKHSVISKEITKFVKRVRTNSGANIRILCVAEAHKDGEPHYHLLIHEMRQDQPVRKKILKAAWGWGHTDWQLCRSSRAASYVCKYLTKSSLARVRASLHYGETSSDIGGADTAPAVKIETSHTLESDGNCPYSEGERYGQCFLQGEQARWPEARPRLSGATARPASGDRRSPTAHTGSGAAFAATRCAEGSALDPPEIPAKAGSETVGFHGV